LNLFPHHIIDAIYNPIILKNEQGVVIACNRAFLHLRKLDANKVIGFTAHDFLSQKEANCHTRADKVLLDAPEGFMQYSYTQIDNSESQAPRNVYKSIIHQPTQGDRQILVVVSERVHTSTPLIAGMQLSPREHEVLELLVRGNSQKQIARRLMISHHTVADYCKKIYQKLGVNSRTEAQLMAIAKLGIQV
jgi:DNA-binding CsgD family transcriptional regulator